MPELIVMLKDRELQRYPILRTTTRVGRDASNDVVIDNPGVSRFHASITFDGDRFVVNDAGSSNGIFVNGQASERHRLEDGDTIQLGKFNVVYGPAGGVAIEKLARDSPLEASERPSFKNPLKTTALTVGELEKFHEAMLAKGAKDGVVSPTEQEARPEERITAVDRPIQVGVATTMMGSRTARQRLEKQAKTFRNVAISLGVLAVGLLGLTAYLLFGT